MVFSNIVSVTEKNSLLETLADCNAYRGIVEYWFEPLHIKSQRIIIEKVF